MGVLCQQAREEPVKLKIIQLLGPHGYPQAAGAWVNAGHKRNTPCKERDHGYPLSPKPSDLCKPGCPATVTGKRD